MKTLCFLLFVHLININAQCLPGFEKVGSQCYFFGETPKSWEDAKTYCKQLGVAHSHNIGLAMMDVSISDNQLFLDSVRTKESGFWIGGKDKGQGYWHWSDGREISLRDNYWYLTEPISTNGLHKCTMVNSTVGDPFGRVYLYSQNCTTHLPYICQEQDTMCPHGFQKVVNSCFFFSSDNEAPRLTWQEARDFCQTLNAPGQADLAMLGTDGAETTQDQELLKIIAAKEKWVFLGASNVGNDTWVWVDGRSLSKSLYYWYWDNPNKDGNVLKAHVTNDKAMIADYSEHHELHYVCMLLQ